MSLKIKLICIFKSIGTDIVPIGLVALLRKHCNIKKSISHPRCSNQIQPISIYIPWLFPPLGGSQQTKKQKGGLNLTHQGFKRGTQLWLRWHCWSTTAHPRRLPPALHNAISPVASATKLSYGSLMAVAIPICVVSLIYNCSPFTPISSTLFRFPHIHSSITHCLLHSIHPSKPWPSSYISPIYL